MILTFFFCCCSTFIILKYAIIVNIYLILLQILIFYINCSRNKWTGLRPVHVSISISHAKPHKSRKEPSRAPEFIRLRKKRNNSFIVGVIIYILFSSAYVPCNYKIIYEPKYIALHRPDPMFLYNSHAKHCVVIVIVVVVVLLFRKFYMMNIFSRVWCKPNDLILFNSVYYVGTFSFLI